MEEFMKTAASENSRALDQLKNNSKQAYSTPALICFGEVRTLTTSGSGPKVEQTTGPPGSGDCSHDKNRKPCPASG